MTRTLRAFRTPSSLLRANGTPPPPVRWLPVRLSPRGDAALLPEPRSFAVLDLVTGEPRFARTNLPTSLECARFSTDGTEVLCFDSECTLSVFDARDGEPRERRKIAGDRRVVQNAERIERPRHRAEISPDGRRVAWLEGNQITIADTATGDVVHEHQSEKLGGANGLGFLWLEFDARSETLLQLSTVIGCLQAWPAVERIELCARGRAENAAALLGGWGSRGWRAHPLAVDAERGLALFRWRARGESNDPVVALLDLRRGEEVRRFESAVTGAFGRDGDVVVCNGPAVACSPWNARTDLVWVPCVSDGERWAPSALERYLDFAVDPTGRTAVAMLGEQVSVVDLATG